MLVLKHIRDWNIVDLEREVRSNLLYREFTGIGAEKVPDAKTASFMHDFCSRSQAAWELYFCRSR